MECPVCSSCGASDRESEHYPNHVSHFSAIGDGVFGISSGGDDARIAIRHGNRSLVATLGAIGGRIVWLARPCYHAIGASPRPDHHMLRALNRDILAEDRSKDFEFFPT